ncbi:3-oxoacyl-ACP reductase FabG [Fervidibacillus halotolerans]|uniref:3-oxoacyl-ACP reductase FabG n=1 Tax=Fervidibacillus halotolerans TaxID=2980027 RepID=A0A9E8RZF3_9BACI|nr:3-oxoacyl-ACP reductase FabG [Fervidibacillus halotolerans]WAA13861.1 3-oxoacyl-ACP reductase FabG [Fervidibacillus halotolerans]
MRLKDKVAIITGAAGGIGFASVKRFLQEGAKVVLADFDKEQLDLRERELNEQGFNNFLTSVVDVSDRKSVDWMVRETVEAFGTIDVLINNAGITRDAMLTKMEPVDFQRVLEVNVAGVFNCTQAVIGQMLEKGSGKIINTSSVSGVYGNIGQTNYAASKAAVIGMTKTWAKELGKKGINVNSVVPGFTETNMVTTVPEKVIESIKGMIPLRRLGKPEDIANAYLFLASKEADYINGAVLHVDGGIMM